MEGMKREVGVKGEVGLGPRKGFRPKRREREVVATEISTAMEMVAREWCWGEVLSLGRGDGQFNARRPQLSFLASSVFYISLP